MNIDQAELINGWMDTQELEWLASIALVSRNIIEVGSFEGRSTRVLCDNTNGTVYAIDPWSELFYKKNEVYCKRPANTFEQFKKNLRNHIDSGRLIPIQSTFEDLKESISSDFIFIDGDHSYEAVRKDICKALELIKSGGIISGHDYTHTNGCPGVKKAVDEFFVKINITGSIWWIKT